MYKQLFLGVVVISVLILWTEADAQTCKRWRNVGGSNVCVAWRPGSQICEVVVSDVNGNPFLQTDAVVTCSVYGTEEDGGGGLAFTLTSFGGGESGGGSGGDYCDSTIDPFNCALQGTLTCRQASEAARTFGHSGSNNCSSTSKHKSDPSCKTFRNVSLDPDNVDFPLTNEVIGLEQCTKFAGGICRTSVPVDITEAEGDAACSAASGEQFPDFQRFVANRGNMVATFCPGGYASDVCCADSQRTTSEYPYGSNACVIENDGDADGYADGNPTVITQRCRLFGSFYICDEREFDEFASE
jgi:hypothetical protein